VTAARNDAAHALQEPQSATAKRSAQKDPKKQAAGKAGAAARKAKQERLLAQLRDAKATMRPDTAVAPCAVEHAGATMDVAAQQPKALEIVRTKCWTPWIIGAAGLAGVAWIYTCTKCSWLSQPSAVCTTAQSVETAAPPALALQQAGRALPSPPVRQLKATTDFFYMH
jgi:hypothetical protein